MRRLIAAVVGAAALVALPAAGAAIGAPDQRIDLQILLLSQSGAEPSLDAWKRALALEGVPYRVRRIGAGQTPLTQAELAAGNRARYQGVVLATSGVDAALTVTERAALDSVETTFGIRQVTAYAFPSARFGLESPFSAGPMSNEVATLTPVGRAVFGSLRGPVPFAAEAWGYRALACVACPGRFDTLVAGSDGAALVGLRTHPGGREEMVVSVDSNPSMIHAQLLRHGLVGWLTRGVYLGHDRNYLALHIDDAFYPDERWNVDLDCTPDPPTPSCPEIAPIRMTAADVARAVSWMSAKGVRLTLAYNADGADSADPLTAAFLQRRNRFAWVNHTWSHENLDGAPLALLSSEIRQNADWARANGVALDSQELVTGEHSGLANPAMPQALAATGVRWIAADASRQPQQLAVGPARTVPRWPTNVFYNTGTRAEQLDEYNYIYLPPELGGSCTNTPVTTCRSTPITWDEYTELESRIMLQHVLANDPRPHFFHQSNLAEDGIFYDVVGRLLDRYRLYFSVPLLQPDLASAGGELGKRARWADRLAAGQVSGYVLDGTAFVVATAGTNVPLTGTVVGSSYGGQVSGWETVARNSTTAFALAPRADPVSTAAPTLAGAPAPGATLVSTTGSWSGGTALTHRYQWQRCDFAGVVCEDVADAHLSTYTVSSLDIGFTLRVVVTAANASGSGTGISARSAPVSASITPLGPVAG